MELYIPEEKSLSYFFTVTKESIRYDYQVKISTPNNSDNSSYPVEAILPIPLDVLISLCGGYTGVFTVPKWNDVVSLIPIKFINEVEKVEEPKHFSIIIQALKRILDNSTDNTFKRCIALLLHNGDFDLGNINESDNADYRQQEGIEVLFRRVNSGGTVLAGEEMQYSILKATWDGAYEMVSNIVNDKDIGYLFSPTSLIMSATRLARFNKNEIDNPNPNVNSFRRWIGEKHNDNSFVEHLKKLLEIDNQLGKSLLHRL